MMGRDLSKLKCRSWYEKRKGGQACDEDGEREEMIENEKKKKSQSWNEDNVSTPVNCALVWIQDSPPPTPHCQWLFPWYGLLLLNSNSMKRLSLGKGVETAASRETKPKRRHSDKSSWNPVHLNKLNKETQKTKRWRDAVQIMGTEGSGMVGSVRSDRSQPVKTPLTAEYDTLDGEYQHRSEQLVMSPYQTTSSSTRHSVRSWTFVTTMERYKCSR